MTAVTFPLESTVYVAPSQKAVYVTPLMMNVSPASFTVTVHPAAVFSTVTFPALVPCWPSAVWPGMMTFSVSELPNAMVALVPPGTTALSPLLVTFPLLMSRGKLQFPDPEVHSTPSIVTDSLAASPMT